MNYNNYIDVSGELVGIKVQFIDNNAKNSPYAKNARDEGFNVYDISEVMKKTLGNFIITIIHTSLAVTQLRSQFNEIGLIENKNFVCLLDEIV